MLACALALLFAAPAVPAAADFDAAMVHRLKGGIVNIEVSVEHGLNAEPSGRYRATGFIVDAARGIIATNRHVVGTSPAQYKVIFEDGTSAEARRLWVDPWHDFGFLELDPDPSRKALEQLPLGDSFGLKEQDDVLMIGNNDGQEYSVKYGKVSNLWLCRGQRHSATIQTTFDRAGGSSGSPVFDSTGDVVAIHFAGTDTTSFELRVEYVKDALAQLQAGGRVQRGEVGVDLDTMLISDARMHFKLPDELARELLALRPDIKRVAYIETLEPTSAAAQELLPGDIVLKLDGRWIGDDVYLFDKLVDERVGGKVTLTVARNGRTLVVRLPVQDAEALKVRSFALFAGAVIQDLTPAARLGLDIRSDGVFLQQAERGSSFSGLGREGAPGEYLVLVESVNGIPTPDLERFIRVARRLKDGDHIYVDVSDHWQTQTNPEARAVRLDLKYSPLQVFDWSDETHDWVRRRL